MNNITEFLNCLQSIEIHKSKMINSIPNDKEYQSFLKDLLTETERYFNPGDSPKIMDRIRVLSVKIIRVMSMLKPSTLCQSYFSSTRDGWVRYYHSNKIALHSSHNLTFFFDRLSQSMKNPDDWKILKRNQQMFKDLQYFINNDYLPLTRKAKQSGIIDLPNKDLVCLFPKPIDIPGIVKNIKGFQSAFGTNVSAIPLRFVFGGSYLDIRRTQDYSQELIWYIMYEILRTNQDQSFTTNDAINLIKQQQSPVSGLETLIDQLEITEKAVQPLEKYLTMYKICNKSPHKV